MADHDLIDTYLDHLAQHLRWRNDSEDLLAEAGDHLHTAVERSVAAGTDLTLAQEQTLERFGQPDLVATAFATTNRGAVAVPTYFTKQAGIIAMISASLWIVAVACWGIASRIEDSCGRVERGRPGCLRHRPGVAARRRRSDGRGRCRPAGATR